MRNTCPLLLSYRYDQYTSTSIAKVCLLVRDVNPERYLIGRSESLREEDQELTKIVALGSVSCLARAAVRQVLMACSRRR